MTREVIGALAGHTQNSIQIDTQYETIQRMRVWGYVFAPIQNAFRICLVTLVIQMMCLLCGIEISFGKIFRIATVAFGALLFGSCLQIFWILLQSAEELTRASLGIVPDSLAAWFVTADDSPSFLYLVLSRVSITSLLWMLLVYSGLRETKQVKPVQAAAVASGTWTVVSMFHGATSLFVRGLVT
jgi:hypothetical protein